MTFRDKKDAVARLLDFAFEEEGYYEKDSLHSLDSKLTNAGFKNYTKYARDLDNLGRYNGKKQGYSWCAVFVFWCLWYSFGMENALKMSYTKLKDNSASCTWWVKYFKQNNAFITDDPQPGDQIFFVDKNGSYYHTGIVINVDDTMCYTIEGNTSSQVGVIPNGGAVCTKRYKKNASYIGGYGRYNWDALIEDSKKQEEEDVTQEQFNKMMDTWLASREKLAPGSWFKNGEAQKFVESNKIVNGDGKGNKKYKSFITREEAAQMLYALSEYLESQK